MIEVDRLFRRYWKSDVKTKKQMYASDAELFRKDSAASDCESLMFSAVDAFRNTPQYKSPDSKHATPKGVLLDILFPELLFRLNNRLHSSVNYDSSLKESISKQEYNARMSCVLFRMARKSLKLKPSGFGDRIVHRLDELRQRNGKLYDRIYMRLAASSYIEKSETMNAIFNGGIRATIEQPGVSGSEESIDYRAKIISDATKYSDSDLTRSLMYHMIQLNDLKELVPGEPEYMSVLFYTQIPELVNRLSWGVTDWQLDNQKRESYKNDLEELVSNSRDVILQSFRYLATNQWPEKEAFIVKMQPFLKSTIELSRENSSTQVLSFPSREP